MNIEIDHRIILRELSPAIISEYLENTYGYRVEDDWSRRNYGYKYVVEDFWHGDFDIKKFIEAIGPLGVEKVKEALNE